MSGQKAGSKTDTLVKVILIFFISLLSFSVGTFVGKQVSDSDHRRMALEGEYKADRGIASTKEHSESTDRISEQEIENLTEEFVNKEKPAGEEAEAHGDTHASAGHGDSHGATSDHTANSGQAAIDSAGTSASAYKSYPRGAKPKQERNPAAETLAKEVGHGAPTTASDATHGVANKLANGQAPSDGAKDKRKPQAILPSVASSAIGKYSVQVASYPEETAAKGHASTLKGKGWTAFYLPANVNGRTYYRVLVGLFDNYKSAQDFHTQFTKESDTKSAIVQKIVQ